MKKRYIFLLISLAFGMLTVQANKEPDARFQKIIKEYTLHEDGSFDFHYYKKLEIKTHFAFNRLYGETFIVYNPEYQELEINKALTTMADGTQRPSPENAFNEVLPRWADGIPAYNHLREMVVTHTGLEVGAIIELDYMLHSNKDFMPFMIGNEVLSESSPVDEVKVIVKVPTGKNLRHVHYNFAGEPEKTTQDGMDVYTWTVTDLEARSRAAHQPEDGQHLPRIMFSTAQNLEAEYDYLTGQQAFKAELDDQIKKAVEKVKAGAKDEWEMTFKLHHMVADEMEDYNIPLHHIGFRPRTPNEVWKSNGGSQLEKAVLLSKIYEEAGIEALPCGVFNNRFYDKGLGNLLGMKKMIVHLPEDDDKDLYLYPEKSTDQNLAYELFGHRMVDLKPGKAMRAHDVDEPENELSMEASLRIDKDRNISGFSTVEFEGAHNPYFKLVDNNEAWYGYLNGLSKKHVKDALILTMDQDETGVQFDFELKDIIKQQANYLFLGVPSFRKGVASWHMEGMAAGREVPLEVPQPMEEEYELEIEIPQGWTLVTLGKELEMETSFGKLEIEIEEENGKIYMERSIEVEAGQISPAQYPDFRKMINAWNDDKNQQLIFKE